MKKNKVLKLNISKAVCNILILMSPVIISSPYSTFFWGEVPVPDILKDDLNKDL